MGEAERVSLIHAGLVRSQEMKGMLIKEPQAVLTLPVRQQMHQGY